ncbi:hypothetical protein [Nocardia miyunensis]|uniref:hypothetical protein n=1 Tax=Nocardia miyunensis TaxID=282684 RepID=UPI000830BDC6|nr:hypothetical protein [Nocardia miyunensis]
MSKDDYANAIIREGRRMGITPRGIVIALATALVESNLVMYANRNDPDSLNYPYEALSSDANSSGLFQQRAPWWGTAADRMDPARSARMFYSALKGLREDYNDTSRSPGWYAQAVQKSAFPGRYDQRMGEAQELYDRLSEISPAVGAAPSPAGFGNAGWGEIIHNFNGQPVSREDMIKYMDARLERVERMVMVLLDRVGGAEAGNAVARSRTPLEPVSG